MRIKIVTESAEAFAELNNTKTASAVFDSLPIESVAHRWGEEVYFEIPLDLCIFFGPTPSSRGNEVRAYSPVSVFGKITGDATIFRDVKEGDLIRVETGD